VEQVLEFATKNQLKEPLSIVDLGTGSGCIGCGNLALSWIGFALELPQSKVKLVDISKQALDVARINLQKFEMQNQVQVEESDAISVQGEFDIIVANPPYIDEKDSRVEKHVRQFEPSTALFAEQQGLQFLKDWSSHHFQNLKPGGLMIFEMGCDQGQAMREHFEKIGFQNVEVIKDYGGLDRFIVGVKHG
jgi:release factor glutamine methyltransferase